MAFSATAIGIVRTDGDDNFGGFFNPGNANMDTTLSVTAGGTGTAPTVSATNYVFIANDVDFHLFLKSGTGLIPGLYRIVSVSAGVATIDASVGAAALWNGTFFSGVNTTAGCATTSTTTVGTWTVCYVNKATRGITYTDIVGVTTTYTSVLNPCGKNIIGSYINVTGGTGYTLQRLEVVSVNIGTMTATVDKTFGAGATGAGSGNLGGALATPGAAGAIAIGGNDVFVRTGTYTNSSASSNVAGGAISAAAGPNATNLSEWEGFGTIPKDAGTAPTISAGSTSSATLFTSSVSDVIVRNINFDGNSQTSSTGISLTGSRATAERCKVSNTTATGINLGSSGAKAVRCQATGFSGTAGIAISSGSIFGCDVWGGSTVGVTLGTGGHANWVNSYSNSGGSSDGFQTSGAASLYNCNARANGRHGFNFTNTTSHEVANCLSEAHASGYEFTATAGVNAGVYLLNCGAYATGSGTINTTQLTRPAEGFITATTTFFVDGANGNFALNADATGGALARAHGFPGVMPRGTSTGYTDAGAIQHADPAASSGGSFGFCF